MCLDRHLEYNAYQGHAERRAKEPVEQCTNRHMQRSANRDPKRLVREQPYDALDSHDKHSADHRHQAPYS